MRPLGIKGRIVSGRKGDPWRLGKLDDDVAASLRAEPPPREVASIYHLGFVAFGVQGLGFARRSP
jgi:hypothetical protein